MPGFGFCSSQCKLGYKRFFFIKTRLRGTSVKLAIGCSDMETLLIKLLGDYLTFVKKILKVRIFS